MSWFDGLPDELSNCLIKLKIYLPDKDIEYDFRPEVTLVYDQLEKQLEDCPQQFVFWSVIYAEQKAKVSVLERELMMVKSRAERQISAELRKSNVKLGRAEINAIIELNETVHNVACQLIEEEKRLYKLKAMVEAIKMKSEHLRSLAGFKREEIRETG